ncbi:MAG TPA: hypothetical protein DEP72_06300 [Clostridiales bacterium]|nr:MAG: hypothetical protein A2Y18_00095 [Clostridiales bacterium GWD2_32_19]HCC07749.1 hypothetical protein [Clostridiales bacterium]
MDSYNRDYHSNQISQRPNRAPAPPLEPVEPIVPVMPDLPTGRATGPTVAPLPVQGQRLPPMTPMPGEQSPQTLESTYYTPGYLRTQIGKMMRIEFLIGSSGPLMDRIGTLLSVGASYVLIRPIGSPDTLLCDIYSIKFVTIYGQPLRVE